MTTSMPSTSMPRAATSVATSTGRRPSAKAAQRPFAMLLAQVAVDGPGVDALFAQGLGQPIGPPFGPAEDQGRCVCRQMAAATFTLSIWWTRRKRWAIAVTVG